MKHVWRKLLRLPLLVGAGALFTTGARANVPAGSGDDGGSPGAVGHRGGEVFLKLENDNIYFSQDAGLTYDELELAATPQTRRLKRLLEQSAEAGGNRWVKVDPTLVADGAGGLQWARPQSATPTDGFDGSRRGASPVKASTIDKTHPRAAPTRSAPANPQ